MASVINLLNRSLMETEEKEKAIHSKNKEILTLRERIEKSTSMDSIEKQEILLSLDSIIVKENI
ncbi:hypothetical protein SDC9_158173 [bioreactor metagenome]|uniref:Uncharacterized protein n=1 Tax=bioreactor metagenome TaxID=1076179 RepID=A0A645FB87_9ZZZZ